MTKKPPTPVISAKLHHGQHPVINTATMGFVQSDSNFQTKVTDVTFSDIVNTCSVCIVVGLEVLKEVPNECYELN